MKKILLMLVLSCSITAIAFCQSKTFSFDYIGPDIPPPCNVYYDQPLNFWDQWKVSHGTPSSGDVYGQNTFSVGKLNANWTGSNLEKSEGLFIDYNFATSHTYNITISVAHNSGGVIGMDVFAASGVTESTNSNCAEDNLPSGASVKTIYSTDAVYDGPTGNFQNVTVSNWTPLANYTQLWVRSRQIYYSISGSLFIDKIIINDLGEIQDNIPPTMPTNLTASSITPESFTLNWTASTDDHFLVGYQIYNTDWVGVGTTSNTSYHLSGLSPCSQNDIKVRAYDSRDNRSPSATVSVKLPTYAPEYRTLQDNLSSSTAITLTATKAIVMYSGFEYNATAQTAGMELKMIANCESYESNGRFASGSEVIVNKGLDTSIITYSIYKLSEEATNISIYPNPVENEFKISVPGDLPYDVTISNSSDQIVKQLFNQNRESRINIAELPSGIYLIAIKTDKIKTIEKIVKK